MKSTVIEVGLTAAMLALWVLVVSTTMEHDARSRPATTPAAPRSAP